MEAVVTKEKEEREQKIEFRYLTFMQVDEEGRPINTGPEPWSMPAGEFLYRTFIQPVEEPQPPQVEGQEEIDFRYRTLDESEEEEMRPHHIEAAEGELDEPEFRYRTLGRPGDEERIHDIEAREGESDTPEFHQPNSD